MKKGCKLLKGKEFIFGDDRPFQSCHAPTLVELDNGDTLAAWFGGTSEKHPDTAIWYSRRKDGIWSYPGVLAEIEGIAMWNPVLFNAPDGRIFLYYKVGENEDEWYTKFILSDSNGISWTEPKELIPGDIGGRGPVKNKPIALRNGTWLAPASVEFKFWDVFVDISKDNGKTWNAAPFVPIDRNKLQCKGVIQPTIWESEPNQVHMLMRNYCEKICRSDSMDNGITWPYTCVLEDEEGEFSYPGIVARGNEISIIYTWKRERMAYVRCSKEDIISCTVTKET